MSCVALLFWHIVTVFLIFYKYSLLILCQHGPMGTWVIWVYIHWQVKNYPWLVCLVVVIKWHSEGTAAAKIDLGGTLGGWPGGILACKLLHTSPPAGGRTLKKILVNLFQSSDQTISGWLKNVQLVHLNCGAVLLWYLLALLPVDCCAHLCIFHKICSPVWWMFTDLCIFSHKKCSPI